MADFDTVAQSLDPNSAISQAWLKSPVAFNPAYATPEQLNFLRAQALMAQKPQPARSWMEAIGNIADAGVGQLLANRAAALDQAKAQATARQWDKANYGAAATNANPASPAPSVPVGGEGGASGAPEDAKNLASFYAPTLGAAGAAGLVGNFGAESGFNPGALNPKSGAAGYAQWLDRRPTLEAYAQKYGASPTDPGIQKKFALVEMGLAGDQSDPGFGTERKAGQALMAARTPQQAVAAGLMYERPDGWSPAHPENSSAYSKRLAIASALMGGQQPGARPNVVAQNAPAGGSPMVGMGGRQIGELMANPNISDANKAQLLGAQFPQAVGTPFGGTKFQAAGQPGPEIPGIGTGAIAYPGGSAPTFTPTTSGGIGPTQLGVPGATLNANDIGRGGNPLSAVEPLVQAGGNMQREQTARNTDQETQFTAMAPFVAAKPAAQQALNRLEVLQRISDAVGNPGLWEKVKQELRDKTWINLGGMAPLDAYRAAAQSLSADLPKGLGGFSPETIGQFSTEEGGRRQINENLRAAFQYTLEKAKRATDFSITDPGKRFAQFDAVQPFTPKWTLTTSPQSPQTAGTQGGVAGPGAPTRLAPPKVGDVMDGHRYVGGPPNLPSSWVKVSP